MNPHFKSQLNDFAQRVILPALELVQQYLERQGHRAWIMSGIPTGDECLDQLLEEQLHARGAQGLIAAMTVEHKVPLGSDSPPERNRFYLAIEGLIQEDVTVVGLPSVFYDQGDGLGFQCFSGGSEALQDGAMPIHQPVDLLNTFINQFEAFQVAQPEALAMPQAERTPIAKIKPVSQTAVEPVAQPMPLPPQESIRTQIRAARLKVQKAQREEVEVLLKVLNLRKADFKIPWEMDLERGSALSRKVMEKRPPIEGEVQQVFDVMVQQALGFAWSLEPISLSEFADYFEIYWTMVEYESISRQGYGTYEDAFVAQVIALGEPEDIHRAKAEISRQMRTLVRSIGLKFGRPDALGCRDCLGFTEIPKFVPLEQMITQIQGRSQQFLVRFEKLSWGILQVYQNAGFMPPSEQALGRHAVLSYWRSARMTIEQPTEAVVCYSVDAEYFEFRFERQIIESGGLWQGIALVRVSQNYGRVVLHSYAFEQM